MKRDKFVMNGRRFEVFPCDQPSWHDYAPPYQDAVDVGRHYPRPKKSPEAGYNPSWAGAACVGLDIVSSSMGFVFRTLGFIGHEIKEAVRYEFRRRKPRKRR